MDRRHPTRHLLLSLAAVAGLAACTITTEVVPPDTSDKKKVTPATKKSAKPSVAPTAKPSPTALPSEMPTRTPTARPSFGPNDFPPLVAPSAATIPPLPSAFPSASADPNALPSASPFVQASAPAPSGRYTIVSGTVYDEEGATIDGAIVTVASLDASVPYSATATTASGSWVVNNVPEGVNVAITAWKDGYTKRLRVGSYQQSATTKNVVNFGAAGGDADAGDVDAAGEPYFISDFPEIASTTPADEAVVTDAGVLIYKLTFSERLPDDSRDDLEDAFVLWPANAAATDGGTAVDLTAKADDAYAAGGDAIAAAIPGNGAIEAPNVAYVVRENVLFNGSGARKATFSWNAEGNVATLTFDAPLAADSDTTTAYQVGLRYGGQGNEIEDEDGNRLGTGTDGALDEYGGLAVGQPIRNAFKEANLLVSGTAGNAVGDRNWATTHDSVIGFEVAEDEVDPKLVGVDATTDDEDLVIRLTFSEAMGAFAGDGAKIHAGLKAADPAIIRHFTFALGEDAGDLDDVDLTGDQAHTIVTAQGVNVDAGEKDARAATSLLAAFPDLADEEFSFDPESLVASKDALSTIGQIAITLDEADPKAVELRILGRAALLDDAAVIKARVGDVGDPAGNVPSDASADQNQVQNAL